MTAPGQVATLILPGDAAWNEGGRAAEPLPVPARKAAEAGAFEAAATLAGQRPRSCSAARRSPKTA